MLLQSIELKNFRQFVDEKVDFSVDEEKNVTLIIGDNGTGKTTFAQAFFWCFYGETDFSDKVMLNREVARNMVPDDKQEVQVRVNLKHGSAEYEIVRKQEYKKSYANKLTQTNTNLYISIRDENGNTRYLKPLECETEIKKILPKELANYFFFDGERIEKMSKEIAKGKKSSGFAEAVVGLTGLKATLTALNHLNPNSKNSVMGKFNDSYSGDSAVNIKAFTDRINEIQNELETITEELAEVDETIQNATVNKDQAEIEMVQYADGERLHKELKNKENELKQAKATKAQYVKSMCKVFNTSEAEEYLALSLVKDAIEIVNRKKVSNRGVPRLHVETLNYILNKGVCLCGTTLNEGSLAYQKVVDLLDYAMPNSAGNAINTFIDISKMRYSNEKKVNEEIGNYAALISEKDDDILELEGDLARIEEKINGENVINQVKKLNQRIKQCRDTIKEGQDTRDKLIKKQALLEDEKKDKEAGRRRLTLVDKNNKQIELYKAYTQALYDDLHYEYKAKENDVRDRLQKLINKIFLEVFDGAINIEIDEKYNIQVTVYDDSIEASTAQSITVIFAFITAIIKMARDNQKENGDEAYSEPYPLVMDAPLSSFDKKRIKAICSSIPQVAEQIIIFIKDTDGDLATEHLGQRVMKRHYFEKIDDFHTKLH